MSSSVSSYLVALKAGNGSSEHRELLSKIEEYHTEKLWHQLTEAALVLVKTKYLQEQGLLEFYHKFVTDFEHKINPLSLVEIVLYVLADITEPDEAVAFMETLKEKVKNNLEARVLCLVAIGGLRLKTGALTEVKTVLEEAGTELDSVSGVTKVHARYYDLCSSYHKLRADHAAYYHDALRYLGCIELNELSREDQCERAFSLALAALLGKDVYNFGELLGHPIMESFVQYDTGRAWLVQLMYAFNSGDIEKFDRLRPQWEEQPDLFQNQEGLGRKIRLLALMELVFRRHAHDRSVTFADVSKAAQISEDQVEALVMKALALGLVKGKIDQVNQVVSLHWVQPRVLDLAQIESLRQRMRDWSKSTDGTIQYVRDQVPDAILTH